MNDPLTCAAVEEMAPDLALGQLAGSDRAGALGHLAACPSCRSLVEDLSALADDLLLLAPEDEPPPGFESGVLAGLTRALPTPRGRRPRPVALALVAAALVLVVGLGGALLMQRPERTIYVNKPDALRTGALMDAQGRTVGHAFIYNSVSAQPSWVFVSVDGAGQTGNYTVVCTGKSAGPLSWPGLHVTDGHGAIGWTAQGDVRGLDHVQLVDAAGNRVYSAQLEPKTA